jgi:hypothetical protein
LPARCPHCSLVELPAIADSSPAVRLNDFPPVSALLQLSFDTVSAAPSTTEVGLWDIPPPVALDRRLATICLLTL